MKRLSDSELVTKAQKELPYVTTAFEILMNRYQNKILNLCHSILKDYHLAEDATQNSMLRVFHYIKNFRNDSSFFTWLYRIAYNESIQIINKNSKQHFSKEDLKDILDVSDNMELELEVQSMLSGLSEEDQELLYLKYTLEFTDEDIATICEVSLSACKMRIKRLKERIKHDNS